MAHRKALVGNYPESRLFVGIVHCERQELTASWIFDVSTGQKRILQLLAIGLQYLG